MATRRTSNVWKGIILAILVGAVAWFLLTMMALWLVMP